MTAYVDSRKSCPDPKKVPFENFDRTAPKRSGKKSLSRNDVSRGVGKESSQRKAASQFIDLFVAASEYLVVLPYARNLIIASCFHERQAVEIVFTTAPGISCDFGT